VLELRDRLAGVRRVAVVAEELLDVAEFQAHLFHRVRQVAREIRARGKVPWPKGHQRLFRSCPACSRIG
jgi:hypothetical protein